MEGSENLGALSECTDGEEMRAACTYLSRKTTLRVVCLTAARYPVLWTVSILYEATRGDINALLIISQIREVINSGYPHPVFRCDRDREGQ